MQTPLSICLVMRWNSAGRLVVPMVLVWGSLGTTSALPVSGASAEYDAYKLHELIACADLAVAGTILQVEPDTFVLQVEEELFGTAPATRMELKRFRDWTCARRWAKYAKGQRVLLFLNGGRVLGAGDEGDMPILDDGVVVGYRLRNIETQTHLVDGEPVEGALVPLGDLGAAICAYRECFDFRTQPETRDQVTSIVPRVDKARLESLASSSPFARHLYEETLSAESRSGEPLVAATESPLAVRHKLLPWGLGIDEESGFGSSADWIGDLDGNGFEDLAVGAYRNSQAGHFHGALWILFLGPERTLLRRQEISESVGGFSASLGEFAEFGTSLVTLGDLDGDGQVEIAVGAPGKREGASRPGATWILTLRADGTVARQVSLHDLPALKAAGVGPDYGLGNALASLGDVDGDGIPDLAAGQDPTFDIGYKNGRSVLILLLNRDGTVRSVRRIHGRGDGFSDKHPWFGESLAGIGDVDRDGVPDLAIGASNDFEGGECGAVWVCFLRRDGSLRGKQKISAWTGGFDARLKEGMDIGEELAGPGDVDGDGTPDLLVGGWDTLFVLFLRPDGSVRSHREFSTRTGTLRPDARFRSPIVCTRRDVSKESRDLLVGGRIDETNRNLSSELWFLQLRKDGALLSE